MKLTLQSIFYFLSIIALGLVIIYLIDMIMDDEDEDNETPVVVVPFIQQYRPYWRRFRHNLPWYGPRPGGRWFGKRPHHRGGRRGGRRHHRP